MQALKDAFFSNPASPTWNPDADLDNNGLINFADLQIVKGQFFGPPGPSAQECEPGTVPAIVNGDFTLPVPSSGTGGGWTAFNNDVSGGWFAAGGSFDAHFILNQAGELTTDPTIEQSIAGFQSGQQYTITGQFEGVYTVVGDPNALSFGVEIVELPGSLIEYQRPAGVGTFSLTFVAGSIEHTLRITGERNGDDSSYRIDNISVAP